MKFKDTKSEGQQRVAKGGSFKSSARNATTSSRIAIEETARKDDVGFRICFIPDGKFVDAVIKKSKPSESPQDYGLMF